MANKIKIFLIGLLSIGAVIFLYSYLQQDSQDFQDLTQGNGRIETTQVDISSKLSGRLLEVKAKEGDLIQKDQILAILDTKELNARLDEANANLEQAKQNKNYTLAIVKQRKSELKLADINYKRATNLYKTKSLPLAELQREESTFISAQAALTAAKSQVVSADATIKAVKAQIETIKVNLEESKLHSPVKGRVLYKIAQNGEMIANGGKVLVVLDLLETYMTIFLPTNQVGLIDIGSEARIVLDAIPNVAIPAKVTFISPLAQFTPKEIETQTEREKLMFRVKVQIDPTLLEKYFDRIKTGLPGVTYIKLDKEAPWPEFLNRLPKK